MLFVLLWIHSETEFAFRYEYYRYNSIYWFSFRHNCSNVIFWKNNGFFYITFTYLIRETSKLQSVNGIKTDQWLWRQCLLKWTNEIVELVLLIVCMNTNNAVWKWFFSFSYRLIVWELTINISLWRVDIFILFVTVT